MRRIGSKRAGWILGGAAILVLSSILFAQGTSSESAAGSSSPSAAASPTGDAAGFNGETGEGNPGNFFERLGHFYAADWKGTLPPGPAAARRGVDPPLDSPPFPNGDWGYNASPTIGAPDGNVYPLMTALHRENSRTKLYGWIDPSLNVSTSSKNNQPLAYAVFLNRLELSQAVVYLERPPNTVQHTHFGFGYHLTALYGIDYRYTTSKGYVSYQLPEKNRRNPFDPVLEYIDLYFPVKAGLDIRIGGASGPGGVGGV